MALNPVLYTERVVSSFLRYQLTRYPFADERLYGQMRALLSLETARRTPLLQGPYISLSRTFRQGTSVARLVADGLLHPLMESLIPHPHVYGHQESAMRGILAGRTTLVATGTGSGKTECFLYPIISRCLTLRDQGAGAGIVAVLIYPMNALAEDQLGRLRGLLAGTGVGFGMYVGSAPERAADVTGERLSEGASRADYWAAFERAQAQGRGTAVHPTEERCSREEMRTPGRQPRILITNVKQLELLLTRQADVELFDGARLEFLVCDEAHTFTGAAGAETACLVRRLRAFCGRGADETTCVATSATIADPEEGVEAGRTFAARFFGVGREQVAVVGEQYTADAWAADRRPLGAPRGSPAENLRAVLSAVDAGPNAGPGVASAFLAMTGQALDPAQWEESLYDRLAATEDVYQIAQALESAQPLPALVGDLERRLGRPVSEEEVLAWLALGAFSRKEGRPLLRPVVHAFVRGVGGAVVTFPPGANEPRLWLSAEDELAARGDEQVVRFPVLNCTTCGQHYFEHHLEDFEFTGGEFGGGEAIGERRVWRAREAALEGKRVLLVDRVIGAEDEEEESPRLKEIYVCRSCGAAHPARSATCDACGLADSLVRLQAVQQKAEHPGKLTRCVSCGAPGRVRGSGYREPARPVRAVAVADVHVLAQDMVHHAERRRLLVFADNRQDAAFQAGWMRDHSRRFRLRALMAERIRQGAVSIGDLTAHLDQVLERDDELSRVLIPEVWEVHRKEAEGVQHAHERKRFLRIQVLRELTVGVKQPTGLEPWGRLRVHYRGLDAESSFVVAKAAALGVPASELADGIAALLDLMRRRSLLLYDREGQIFSRFWNEGDFEVQRGYLPRLSGVPKGLKLRRAPSDDPGRVDQWASEGAHLTSAREIVRGWGVEREETDGFLEDLWRFLAEDLEVLVPVTLRGSKGNALPRCAGTYQIDADKLRLAPIRELYRCRKCRRAQVRPTPHRHCMGWHCDGTLEFEPENRDSYDLTLLDAGFEMIRPREHSAQVPHEDRDRIERLFKGNSEALNTLVCTPTLELGVDIGQLDTVLLRNVPPLPANYWQRVGRAGRRHRMAVNITYARPASHDQLYFSNPLKMLEGRVDPPRFNLRNDLMVEKHAHAAVLTRLHQLAREGSGLGELERGEIVEALEQVFPPRVGGYLFEEDGTLRTASFDVAPLRRLLARHESDLLDHVRSAFRQGWPEEDASAVSDERLRASVRGASAQLDEVIARFRKRLNWALAQMARLDQERRRKGTLDPAEDALYTRCDRLVKRYKGQEYRRRRDTEGYDDTNTFAALAAEGYLPGYGLDVGSVVGTAQLPRYLATGRDFDLRRPTTLAVREFVPGNLIYANGQRFVPRYYHLEPEDPAYFQVDPAHAAVAEIGAAAAAVPGDAAAPHAALAAQFLRAVAMCDVDLPHFSHISDDEEFRFQLSVAVYGYEKGRHDGGSAYRWGERTVWHRRGVHLRLVNAGASRLVSGTPPRLGYPVCLVCGQTRSPFASQRELDQFEQDHRERCGKPVEATGFFADVVADALSLPGCAGRDEAYSILEALRLGAANVLDMEVGDLDILIIGHAGGDQVDALLFDPMPGGSGLLDQIVERFPEVVAAALEVVGHCPSACARACGDCLLRFRNTFFHKHLDRNLAAELMGRWGDRLELGNPIPSAMPASAPQAPRLPANAAESALRAMLQRAGFPEGQWQFPIALGRPLGSTTPDCCYEDEPGEPGTCIYLDGLSEHIHGNPETAARDRQIRDELRARGYEVLEIAASDLYDRDKMARHFFRLGRTLLGKDRARAIRDQSDWFEPPPGAGEAAPSAETPGESGRAAEVLPFRVVRGEPAERFRTCVPLMSLKAAAGAFGEVAEVEPEAWVEPNTTHKLGPGMFVAQVVGRSMEPRIPNGAYVLFRSPVTGSRTGRILLVQHRDIHDPETGGSYTVKEFDSRGVTGKDTGEERIGTILLKPLNPEYIALEVSGTPEDEVRVIAEVVDILSAVYREA